MRMTRRRTSRLNVRRYLRFYLRKISHRFAPMILADEAPRKK